MGRAVARIRIALTIAGILAIAGAASGVAAAAPVSALTPKTNAGVPAGFEPVSASFVSPSWGVVLGATNCQGTRACPAQLAVTADGGSHWHFIHAPAVTVNHGGTMINRVVFASSKDGYLFEQFARILWTTTDGGRIWTKRQMLPGLEQIQPAGHQVYLLAGGTKTQLFVSKIGTDVWSEVAGVTGYWIGASGPTVWVGSNFKVWTRQGTGSWHKYPFTCPKHYGLTGISAASSARVAFSCAQFQGSFHANKLVLASTNGGQTEHVAGRQAPNEGANSGFAVPAGRPGVFVISVVTLGQSYLARSASGGQHWTTINVPQTTGGTNLSSLAFASSSVGIVVVGGPSQLGKDGLLRTTNAGPSWDYVT